MRGRRKALDSIDIDTVRSMGATSEYERARQQYGLTRKQYDFCKIYVACGNGTQAVIDAGYQTSKNQARIIASTNLTKENIKNYIEQLIKEKEKRAEKNKANSGFGMNDIISMYIDLVNTTNNDSVKRAALSDLTRIYGGFAPDKLDVSANIDISNVLEQARRRQLADINTIDAEPLNN